MGGEKMIKRKVFSYTVAGLLAVGIGGTGATIFAMNNQQDDTDDQSEEVKAEVSSEFQQIKDELESQGILIPDENMDPEEFLKNLDPTTMEKIDEISVSLKAKAESVSPEEVLELRKQRINLPEKESKNKFVDIDEETKDLARDLFQQVLNGSLTLDAATAELSKHGISFSEQEISVLQNYLNSEDFAETNEIYNNLQEGKISEEEAREEIMKRRINNESKEDDMDQDEVTAEKDTNLEYEQKASDISQAENREEIMNRITNLKEKSEDGR